MNKLKYLLTSVGNRIAKRGIGPFATRAHELSESQYFSVNDLQALQFDLLKHILLLSYRDIPFYKHWMDQHGFHQNHLKSLEDVSRLPILTKKEVLEAGEEIVSTKYKKWQLRVAKTGGSTGTPMNIWRNWDSIGNEHAFLRRQWSWAGLELRDRCAYFMSKVISKPGTHQKLYFYDPVMKELLLSTYHLSEENDLNYIELIKDYKIKALVGYPSAICFLAKVCKENNMDLSLTAALTTSEMITPEMRKLIGDAFHCKVFDYYGSAERVCYIFTCEMESYHLIPEYGYTELLPIAGDGRDRYKIISTGFWNHAMPLIRYDTGDIVYRSGKTCQCGRHFPVIQSIDGREGDVIRTPSGRELGVTLIIQLLYVICGSKCITESQMIQDAIDHVTIEYVPTSSFTKRDLDKFIDLVEKYIPEDLSFDFKEVEMCKRTVNGKLRPLVSLTH